MSPVPLSVPVGVVLPYAGPLANSDAGPGIEIAAIRAALACQGWLFCDGASVSIHDYPDLYGVIGNAFGAAAGAGTFCLPDLRGRFVRGVSDDSGRDPDVTMRSAPAAGGNTDNQVGSLQGDAFQGHEHSYNGAGEAATYATGSGSVVALAVASQTTTGEAAQPVEGGGDDGAPRVSKETRPVNLYLNHLIRYR